MDREKYDGVLEACSLKTDMEILSFRDQTVIGERGINLSGGQKQRIQTSRALSQDADIYLFDDPLRAVDAHTGSFIGPLKIQNGDLCYSSSGVVACCGSYLGTDYMGLVGAHQQALSVLGSKEGGLVSRKKSMNKENGGMDTTNGVTMKKGNEDVQTDKVGEVAGPKGQLVQEEEKEKGRVGFSKYWQHITTAYGGAVVPFILLAQIFFQILQIGSNYWMALATPKPAFGSSTLIIVYVALALGSSFCIFARSTYLATIGFETATLLFNKMHLCLFRAPMSFFDATPSGRARKRASTDQSAVDLNIASQVGAFAFSMVQLLGIMTVMSQAA